MLEKKGDIAAGRRDLYAWTSTRPYELGTFSQMDCHIITAPAFPRNLPYSA